MEKKTKIIASIGPASDNREIIKDLVKAGINCARINMSHATYEEVDFRIKTVREVNAELHTNVGILIDTKGPEIRTSSFENGGIHLVKGAKVTLLNNVNDLGTHDKFGVTYQSLASDVEIGQHILLSDGLVTLKVMEICCEEVICEVLTDGFIKDRRGVNIPGLKLNMEFLSDKDKSDLKTACLYDVDYVAMSFVSDANDVKVAREFLDENGGNNIKIISKVESSLAIENIDEIIASSDAIMIARGDMGVELPYEQLPLIQKRIIEKCRKTNTIVITATEMMASMEYNPRPTRAEISDVANAIIDQTDAIMLSGETAQGKYPVETVEAMTRIATHIEENLDNLGYIYSTLNEDLSIPGVIAYNIAENATKLESKAILVTTMTGETARLVSNYRPGCPIIALTPNKKALTQLSIAYGIITHEVEVLHSADQIIEVARKVAIEEFKFQNGTVVVSGGYPFIDENQTNFMKIEII